MHRLEAAARQPDADGHRQHVDEHHALEPDPSECASSAAPSATASSGCTPLRGRLAEERGDLLVHQRQAALATDQDAPRRCPAALSPLALSTSSQTSSVRSTSCSVSSISFSRVSVTSRSYGLSSIIVTNGTCTCASRALGERALGPLGRVGDPLHGHAVALERVAGLLLELVEQVVDDRVVEVDAAQERVAAGGDHLVDVVVQLEHARRRRCRRPGRRPARAARACARSRTPAPRRWAR